MNRLDSGLLNNGIGAIGIESRHFHSETLGDTGHIAANLTERMDTDCLVFKFRAGCTVVHIADSHHGHTEHEFRNGIGILTGGILYAYAMGGCRCEIHIVVTGTCTDNDFQILRRIKHLGIHNVTADDQTVGRGYCIKKLLLAAIFFKKGKFITGALHYFSYSVDSCGCKRFFCCYKHLHGSDQCFDSNSFIAATSTSTLSIGRAL